MVYRCDRRATNASSCALSDPGKDPVPASPGPVALSWHDLQDLVQLCSPDRPEAPQQPQIMPTSSRRSSAAEIFTRENENGRDLISTGRTQPAVRCGRRSEGCVLQCMRRGAASRCWLGRVGGAEAWEASRRSERPNREARALLLASVRCGALL